MEITKIKINNFRKLKDNVEFEFKKDILIVGKNNTGKTSISEIFYKFLSPNSKFGIEDFNYKTINKSKLNIIPKKFNSKLSPEEILDIENLFPEITLELEMEISKDTNLYKIREMIYELKNNDNLILVCKFKVENAIKVIEDFKNYIEKLKKESDEELEKESNNISIDFYNYIKRNLNEYYKCFYYTTKKGCSYKNHVSSTFIQSIFNIGIISAQRNVDDTSDQNTQTISNAIWNYYQRITCDKNDISKEDKFSDSISNIKLELDGSYNDLFKGLVERLESVVLNNEVGQKIDIISEFKVEELLKKNSKFRYSLEGLSLPESYNGLGYSNILYMFIQLVTYYYDIDNKNAIFNILFIEEPESHLHPQMQSVFIEKLYMMFNDEVDVYKVITSHSSYILQKQDLDDIRYFLCKNNNIYVKSLDKFLNHEEYIGFKEFLKKYFMVSTCDLFFADKAILIEGTVERMLMPLFIEKLCTDENPHKDLIKQHISTIEVGGAYAHIFNNLLKFLEIKTLIITDIDSVDENGEKCRCDISDEGDDISNCKIRTSNGAIKDWYGKKNEKLYIKEIVSKSSKKYRIKNIEDNENFLMLSTQLPLNDETYWGRTFEEQFIIENSEILIEKLKDGIRYKDIESLYLSINKVKDEDGNKLNATAISKVELEKYAHEIVSKIDKTNFAFDLLVLENWNTPSYIEEGLNWLSM